MGGRIPEDKIQEIRDRIDIVEVVSGYLPLKRSGANYQGLCPFHAEKTPSFNVNAPRQIFHCFGCGVGGNVFSFLMRMEGLSFPEAVRRLGERVGVEIEEERISPAEEKRRAELELLARINEVACDFYHRILVEEPEGAEARRYLRGRGYDGETVRRFRLGYAPDAWEALAGHLQSKGFDPNIVRGKLGLTRAGKQGRGDYDLFRRRLLFPILDTRGQVVAFGGRVLDDSLPKYINSPESPLYHKGRILYGLYQAREAMRKCDEGIVVEGYFDQLALHRAGFENAVATCGTALTADHARLLKRYAKRLLLLFDQDRAGQQATSRAMEVLLPAGASVAVVELPAGEDPDSFLRKQGGEDFLRRLQDARPVLEWYMEQVLAAHGAHVEGRARAVEEVLDKLRLLPSDIERSLYLKSLAAQTEIEEALLQRKLARSEERSVPAASRPAPSPTPPVRRRAPEAGRGLKAQQMLLHMMLTDPRVRRRVGEEGGATFFSDPDHRAVAEAVLDLGGSGDGRLDQALLESRLNPEQEAILSGILIRDEDIFAEVSEQIFEDCRKVVENEQLRRRIAELNDLIRDAEARGDAEARTRYQTELTRVALQLKKR